MSGALLAVSAESVGFWVVGPLAVLGAVMLVVSRKAVHSALWLAATMISLAVMYIMQGAVFLGVVQVIVYTGAVMMLFLFVLMLVGVDASDSLVETLRGQRVAAVLVGLGFGVLLIAGLGQATIGAPVGIDQVNVADGGNVQGIAQALFTRYLWAFEVTSALLITAAIGAMVLAHRERVSRKLTQRELSILRFHGDQQTPLPPPGSYARHNAVDTPALLPDGTPSDVSIPVPLGLRGEVHTQTPVPLQSGTDADDDGGAA